MSEQDDLVEQAYEQPMLPYFDEEAKKPPSDVQPEQATAPDQPPNRGDV